MRNNIGLHITSFPGLVIVISALILTGCEKPARQEAQSALTKSASSDVISAQQAAAEQKQDANNLETKTKDACSIPAANEPAKIIEASSPIDVNRFVLIEGGTFKNAKSNYFGTGKIMPSFYIGKYEVTQKEWTEVMGSNPSKFTGDDLPVETVSWYDCVEYCNKRSIKEGLKPYYNIDKNIRDPHIDNEYDDIRWLVTVNAGANGYRLPTEEEWEYAASGGQKSKGYKYSGSNDVNQVGWFWRNSGDKYLAAFWTTHLLEANHNKTLPVGCKTPNELGLYDMSGNVREWCWDWHEGNDTDDSQGRVWKGGGWIGDDFCCLLSFQGSWVANSKGSDTGFRVCRSK